MDTAKISKQNIEKLLKESQKAASIAVKNKDTIETLISIHQIKSGNYTKASSGQDLFRKLGI